MKPKNDFSKKKNVEEAQTIDALGDKKDDSERALAMEDHDTVEKSQDALAAKKTDTGAKITTEQQDVPIELNADASSPLSLSKCFRVTGILFSSLLLVTIFVTPHSNIACCSWIWRS